MAIVTSLFCEKVAVDAMIEEKTTYVKYKTEGEVHFYVSGFNCVHWVILTHCMQDMAMYCKCRTIYLTHISFQRRSIC